MIIHGKQEINWQLFEKINNCEEKLKSNWTWCYGTVFESPASVQVHFGLATVLLHQKAEDRQIAIWDCTTTVLQVSWFLYPLQDCKCHIQLDPNNLQPAKKSAEIQGNENIQRRFWNEKKKSPLSLLEEQIEKWSTGF